MAGERPSLAGEYEIALAAVNLDPLNTDLTFAETPYPAIIGTFAVITCTTNLKLVPPVDQTKTIRNGYNPAAQIIPGESVPGSLSFELLDRAVQDAAAPYNGVLCVARIKTNIEHVTERTIYCSYYTPHISTQAGSGEDIGNVSAEGPFTLLAKP